MPWLGGIQPRLEPVPPRLWTCPPAVVSFPELSCAQRAGLCFALHPCPTRKQNFKSLSGCHAVDRATRSDARKSLEERPQPMDDAERRPISVPSYQSCSHRLRVHRNVNCARDHSPSSAKYPLPARPEAGDRCKGKCQGSMSRSRQSRCGDQAQPSRVLAGESTTIPGQ